MRLLRLLLILTAALITLGSGECGGDSDTCRSAKDCELVCGKCLPACLPTGEGGAGQCHCSCGK